MNLYKYVKNDWLKMNKYDVFSTEFPIIKDTLLFENRLFSKEISLYMQNKINTRMNYLSIINMKKMNEQINKNMKENKNKTRKKRT